MQAWQVEGAAGKTVYEGGWARPNTPLANGVPSYVLRHEPPPAAQQQKGMPTGRRKGKVVRKPLASRAATQQKVRAGAGKAPAGVRKPKRKLAAAGSGSRGGRSRVCLACDLGRKRRCTCGKRTRKW